MIEEIKRIALAAGAQTGRPVLDPRVLAAMAEVPRHEFTPWFQKRAAYKNRALLIGHGQTISQPFMVALMTDLLRLGPGDSVLEIGAGSGYQTAILSRLAARVHTVEIIPALARAAKAAFARLGYRNIEVREGDGYQGWAEHAPYDAILVTAAPGRVPPPLIAQLSPKGRLVIPVGETEQTLIAMEKNAAGETAARVVAAVRFVPLTREPGR